jgi:hypothetical protein
MPELELVEERLISGKGVLRVPSAARKARYWIMYADVIRLPTNEYRELNWNPYQSLYARMVYRRDGYVQTYDHIRFTREQRTYINDITGQNLRAIKCAYEGILQTFFNLGNALALPSISITNLIKDYESIALSWDEILFSCYSNTALQIRFFKKDYDVCNAENDDSDDPPPPPPPLPPVPPGTSIGSISPPYENDPDTDPFEGDESEPPPLEPPGEACIKYRVNIQHASIFAPGFAIREIICYGEIGEPLITPSGAANALQLPCRGYAFPTLDEGCQPEIVNRTVFVSDSVSASPPPFIVSFEEYLP